ncbi:MAG: phosphate uptake regulator, PhoU [Acidimicrobiaceae bacterium]|nr:phosphate uptake regulator, PhoU [Acidimicrobiaceae bacterium]
MAARLYGASMAQKPDDRTLAIAIDRQVIQLFALVSDAVAGATHALLAGDRAAAKALVAREEEVDALYRDIEQTVQDRIAEGAGSPQALRYLIAVLGVLPELERSGDLAEHIARRATRGITTEMSARARGLVERMGEVASAMWRMSADAFGDRAPAVADRLDELDDEMDELHGTFITELAGGGMSVPVVIELVLVGRFYERLGDHAVNIARRVPARSGLL